MSFSFAVNAPVDMKQTIVSRESFEAPLPKRSTQKFVEDMYQRSLEKLKVGQKRSHNQLTQPNPFNLQTEKRAKLSEPSE
jgi:hypothetical protein